jgi:hypothetical protein
MRFRARQEGSYQSSKHDCNQSTSGGSDNEVKVVARFRQLVVIVVRLELIHQALKDKQTCQAPHSSAICIHPER